VQQQILAGRFPLDVAAELDRHDVAWWRVDARTRAVEPRFRGYREANFVPLEGELWVAGRRLVPGAAGGAPFELRVSGLYWWVNPRGGALRIDGREVPSPVLLADGRHLAAWDGGGPLLLVAAPPETWPAALRAGIAR
jgi:hypothetical protein